MATRDYAKSGDSVTVSLCTETLGSYPLYRLHHGLQMLSSSSMRRFLHPWRCMQQSCVVTGLIQVQISGRVTGNTCSLITSVLQLGWI